MLASLDRLVSPRRTRRTIAGNERWRLDDLRRRHVVRVDVEDEGTLRELLVASLTFVQLAGRNIKKVPEDLVHRKECCGHSAGSREKLTTRDTEALARVF